MTRSRVTHDWEDVVAVMEQWVRLAVAEGATDAEVHERIRLWDSEHTIPFADRRRLEATLAAASGAGSSAAPVDATPGRGPGRPSWTRALFAERYAEALAVTDPPMTLERVAGNFRALDGTKGIDAKWLAQLRRRHG